MKPKFLLSIILVFICVIGYSQDKGYIALSAGPSFPTGDFGSQDVNNEPAVQVMYDDIIDITDAQKFCKPEAESKVCRCQDLY